MNQTKPPQIGTFANKLCIRSHLSSRDKPSWIPIIGPLHDDPKFIESYFQHYHIDWRYLTQHQVEILERTAEYMDIDTNKVVIDSVVPEGSPKSIDVDNTNGLADEFPVETYLKAMRRRCAREFPNYPSDTEWLPAMETAFQNEKLIDGRCPHQQTDLSTIPTDANGNVTCPMHGLSWNRETGRLAKRANPPRSHKNLEATT